MLKKCDFLDSGLKSNTFKLPYDEKPKYKLTTLNEFDQTFLSDWPKLNTSVVPTQLPICRNFKKHVTYYILMAEEKKIPCCLAKKERKKRLDRLVKSLKLLTCFLIQKSPNKSFGRKCRKNQEQLSTVQNSRSLLQITKYYN